MQCTMTGPGLPQVRIAAPHSLAADKSRSAPRHPGSPCRQACGAGSCPAARAAEPVLDAFSAVVSHEPVFLAVESDQGTHPLEENGQWAALRMLLAAVRESGCPYFRDLLPKGIGRPGSEDCRTAFLRVVRERIGRDNGRGDRSTPQGRADAVEARLAPLLREARRRCRQDAAINAVVILINCVRLALADAEDGLPLRQGADAVRVVRRGRRKAPAAAGRRSALMV